MIVAERTAELRRASTELRTILDASPVGIVLFRPDFTVQRCNAAFERTFRLDRRGARAPPEPLVRRDPRRVGAGPRSPREGGGTVSYGDPDAPQRRVGVRRRRCVRALTNDSAFPAGFVANVGDISDRKRAEASLRKTQAELAHVTRVMTLGELAASIAHEINQPLTAIIANASVSLNLLTRPDPDIAMVRQVLTEIMSDSHRAGNVIKRLRQLATKGDPHRTLLDLNTVIDEVAALVDSEIHKHGAKLRLALATDLPLVYSDRIQLQQVMINLVMNGLEAMDSVHDRPRRLTIRTEASDGASVRVAVQDAGVGIDAENADRMFDAFFTTKPKGMGMGLSISRSIIEGNGGRLWATPNSKVGATFQFELPVAPPANT